MINYNRQLPKCHPTKKINNKVSCLYNQTYYDHRKNQYAIKCYDGDQPIKNYDGDQPIKCYDGDQPIKCDDGDQPIKCYDGDQPIKCYDGDQKLRWRTLILSWNL